MCARYFVNDWRRPWSAVVVLVAVLWMPLVQAAICTVCTGGSCNYTTIKAAIDAIASPGPCDTIQLPASYTTVAGDITTAGNGVTISKNLTIEGTNPNVTVQGLASNRVFTVTSAVTGTGAFLKNLTITGGSATDGGGIHNSGTLTVENCTITGNTATGTTTANGGGGIFNSSTGTLTILNSTINGNSVSAIAGSTSAGGGIYNNKTLNITNTTINNNTSVGRGGGIYNNTGATVDIVSSTIMSNIANVAGNSAGGGIRNSGTANIKNSIVADNSCPNATSPTYTPSPDVAGTFTSGKYNLISNITTGATGFTAGSDEWIASPTNIGTLADNGGFTQTRAPTSPSSNIVDKIPSANCSSATAPIFNTPVRRYATAAHDTRADALDTHCGIGAYEVFAEIAVSESATNIANGTGSVNFGTTFIGTPVTKTFTIDNSVGNYALNLSNLSLPTGFSVVGTFPTSVAAGAAATFQIKLDAAIVGTFNGTLSFATNDRDENPFNFAISGTVINPGYGSSPLPSNPIPFPTTVVPNASTGTLAISETGTTTLDVTNAVISGTDAGKFSFTPPFSPFSILDSGANQSLTITCNGSVAGTYSATLTVTHNAVGGTATYPLSCTVTQPSYSLAPSPTSFTATAPATPASQTLTITNSGTATLNVSSIAIGGTDAGKFSVTPTSTTVASGGTQTVTVQCTTNVPGNYTATLTVTHDAPGGPTDTYSLTCTINAPAYGSSPAIGSTLTFTTPVGSNPTQTLAINNTGTATLNVTTGTSITGTNASKFSIVTSPPLTINSGGSQSLTVQCNGNAVGTYTATLAVTHNAGGSPANYPLSCTVTAAPAPGYSSSPTAGGTLNFTTTAPTSTTQAITISENGTAALTITGATLGGTDAGKFSVVMSTPFTIADGGAAQPLTVQCNGSVAGTFTATLTVAHNASGSPATYNLSCTVSTTAVAGYGSTPAPSGTLTFAAVSPASATQTLTVQESGTATLNVTGASISGTNASQFSFNPAFSAFNIADNGAAQSLTIQCNGNTAGTYTATLTVTHNATGSPATYLLSCTISPPAVAVYGSAPVAASTVNFTTTVPANTTQTVTISNTGTAPLNDTIATITGTDAAKFSFTPAFSAFTIANGSADVPITIQCDGTVVGTYTATLTITHDASGSPATYPLSCLVSAIAVAGYGSAPVPGSALNFTTTVPTNAIQTVTIQETGTATLNVTAATITGADATKFSFSPAFSTFNIADGGPNQILTIQCNGSVAGTYTATLEVTHNANGNPATYPLSCTVNAMPSPVYNSAPAAGSTLSFTTAVPINTTQTLTIQELGNATLNVTSATLSGTNAGKFSLVPAFSVFNIADGGASVPLTIQCNGSVAGTYTATLTVSHNASGSPAIYNLSCSVGGTPGYASTPAPGNTLSFSTVAPASPTQTISVQETGTAVLNITSATITGAGASKFSVTPGALTIADNGASQSLTVTCNGSDAGTYSATLVAAHNASGSPATYNLTCTVTDLTPPSFISTVAKDINQNGFNLETSLNEPGKVYYVVLPKGANVPSVSAVKSGNVSGRVTSGSFTVSAANTIVNQAITGLSASTAYDVYVVAEDNLGNIQTTPTQFSITTSVLPRVEDIKKTSFDLTVRIIQPVVPTRIIYVCYMLIPRWVIYRPAYTDIMGITRGIYSPIFSPIVVAYRCFPIYPSYFRTATAEGSDTVTGLEPGTQHNLYVVAEDEAGVPVQEIPLEFDVTTAPASAPDAPADTPEASTTPVQPSPTESKTKILRVFNGGGGHGNFAVSPKPLETNCKAENDCTYTYDRLAIVTLTATPADDSTFWAWGGTDDCDDGKVVLNADQYCTAYFFMRTYTLDLAYAGDGHGSISVDPACNNALCRQYDVNTEITFTPAPNADSTFAGFSGDCVPDGRLTMTADKKCIATFNLIPPPPPIPTYTLAVTAVGNGTVAVVPATLCADGIHYCYPINTVVVLTPTAAADNVFTGWTGDADCAHGQITMTADKSCTATFVPLAQLPTHAVMSIPAGDGDGVITQVITHSPVATASASTCGDNCTRYPVGTQVTLTATPSTGTFFSRWSGDDDCMDGKLTLDADKYCGAIFTKIPRYFLTVAATANKGEVNIDPVGSTLCPVTTNTTDICYGYEANADVKLTATAYAGFVFSGWQGSDDCSDGSVTMTADRRCLALFAPVGTAQFANLTFATAEDAGTATVTANRVAGVRGPVMVAYATADATATAASGDYTPTTGTLTWADQESGPKTFTVPIALDQVSENQETVLLSLTDPTTGATLSTATLSITDVPWFSSVQFAVPALTVKETDASVKLLVTRAAGVHGALSVDYATQDGTAVAGSDYTPAQGTLNWADGDSAPKTIDIPLLTDTDTEESEKFSVTLSNLVGNGQLGTVLATVTITDVAATANGPSTSTDTDTQPPAVVVAPSAGTLQLSQPAYTVGERDGEIKIYVTRSGGSAGEVNVNYATADSSAINGAEYTASQGILHWADGDTDDKLFTVGILDDIILETDKEFTVSLSNVAGGAMMGANVRATVIIKDDDTASVYWMEASKIIAENTPQVTLTVKRDGSQFGQVSVNYATVDGTAAAHQDYTPVQGTLTWLNGDANDKTITVPLHYQPATEGNETFELTLTEVNGATLGTPSTVIVTLAENDLSGCAPANNVIDCFLVNTETLTNVRITARGTVAGGQLDGQIQNAGWVQDVTLLPGTRVTGGIVQGQINGDDNVFLSEVTINAHTVLNKVTIGRGSVVASDIVIQERVTFEDNSLIPSGLDLAVPLGYAEMPTLGQYGVQLRGDVLTNSAVDGILGAMNGLSALESQHLVLTQDPETGYLLLKVGDARYVGLPIQVKQVLTRQADRQIPLGLTQNADGTVTFITHTGREVTVIPVVQDLTTLQNVLNLMGLPEIILQANGHVRVPVPGQGGIYYSALPNLVSTLVSPAIDALDGIYQTPSTWLPTATVALLRFTDTFEKAQREQLLYPAAADPAALVALATGNQEAVLENDGRVLLRLNKRTIYGLLDYIVTPSTYRGPAKIDDSDDVNGDGLADYRIVYPNGDSQILFRLAP